MYLTFTHVNVMVGDLILPVSCSCRQLSEVQDPVRKERGMRISVWFLHFPYQHIHTFQSVNTQTPYLEFMFDDCNVR